jgi:hypothetical protein
MSFPRSLLLQNQNISLLSYFIRSLPFPLLPDQNKSNHCFPISLAPCLFRSLLYLPLDQNKSNHSTLHTCLWYAAAWATPISGSPRTNLRSATAVEESKHCWRRRRSASPEQRLCSPYSLMPLSARTTHDSI